jgi:hypothetical protein
MSGGTVLRQARDDDAGGAGDLAFLRRFLAGDQPHEAGLARAVAADETDPFARVDLEVHAVEQRGGGVAKGDLAKLQERHGLWVIAAFGGRQDQITKFSKWPNAE